MTTGAKWAGGLGLAMVTALGMYLFMETKPDNRIPRRVIQDMTFPAGFNVTGDKDGVLCHEIRRRFTDGRDDLTIQTHRIPHRDFRTGTEADKRAWLIDDVVDDMGDKQLACVQEEPWFFRAAYADPPYCEEDCGGSGCISWTCPATWNVLTSRCNVPGYDCAVTFVCCGHGCTPSC